MDDTSAIAAIVALETANRNRREKEQEQKRLHREQERLQQEREFLQQEIKNLQQRIENLQPNDGNTVNTEPVNTEPVFASTINPLFHDSMTKKSSFMESTTGESLAEGTYTNKPIAKEPLKWYQQSWATIMFLLFFYPVGIVLMWRHLQWNNVVKVVITAFFVMVTIYVLMNPETTVVP